MAETNMFNDLFLGSVFKTPDSAMYMVVGVSQHFLICTLVQRNLCFNNFPEEFEDFRSADLIVFGKREFSFDDFEHITSIEAGRKPKDVLEKLEVINKRHVHSDG